MLMNKRFHKSRAYFHPTVVLRTHMFPYRQIRGVEELLKEFENDIFREALILASPSLVKEVDRFLNSKTFQKEKLDKFKHNLHKYWIRAHSRTTPFGLFASCSTLRWSPKSTKIVLKSPSVSDRKTRIDMELLCQLLNKISSCPESRQALIYYPNDSLFCKHDRLNYVKYNYSNSKRVHQVHSLHQDLYLREAINSSKKGATFQEIANSIVTLDNEISTEEALRFVNVLVEEQIIKPNLEPGITCGDPLLYAINLLKNQRQKNNSGTKYHNLLIALDDIIKDFDNSVYFDRLHKRMSKAINQFELSSYPKNTLSVTGKKHHAIESRLDNRIQNQLISAAEVLVAINSSQNAHFEKFKQAFRERYEARQVPLLEVLDPEIGLGYPIDHKLNTQSAFTRNIVQTEQSSSHIRQSLSFSPWDSVLHRILTTSQSNKEESINLEEYIDENKLRNNTLNLPNSLSIRFSLVEDGKKSNALLIRPTGFSSAINLLGRFSESDQEIKRMLQEISDFEEKCAEPAILAEVIHLPQEREGNISIHSPFREFEIPYLSSSSVDEEFQISANDLFVSIENDRIILTSKRLKKEVLPTLSSAHNFTYNTLPVYRFLSSLHTQGKKFKTNFNWGPFAKFFNYFPRVYYRETIVQVAKWTLSLEDYEEVISFPTNEQTIAVQKWRQGLGIPKHIAVVRNDAELPLNLENPFDVETFISFLKKKKQVIIHEFLFEESCPQVVDEDGGIYCNEFITSLLIDNSAYNKVYNKLPTAIESGVIRTFPLGSDWLYYKIYSPINTSEKIVVDTLESITNELLDLKLITAWFFIRYGDPSNHLRLRFQLQDQSHISSVIQIVRRHFDQHLNTGAVTKLQTDTYIREIERYGANTIVFCENWFYIDSKYTMLLLKEVNQLENMDIKWKLAISSIDKILNYFELDTHQKLQFSENRKKSYKAEFKTSKATSRSMNLKYREHRDSIKKAVNMEFMEAGIRNEVLQELLDKRNKEARHIFADIKRIYADGKSQVPKEQLISSIIHMHVNRFMKENQRFQELMCYTMLEKYYRNTLAISKLNKA